MDNQEIAKKDFMDKSDGLNRVFQYQESFFDTTFLNIKLAFLAFISVIVTIIFQNKNSFSWDFIFTLSIILLFLFVFVIIELIVKYHDVTSAMEKQSRRTGLAKIRHIATLDASFNDYGKRAEELLIQEDTFTQKMKNRESISDILRQPNINIHTILFVAWLILFLSVPIIFLLEISGKI